MVKDIKNILVTGGAGFIGSYVVDELVSAGYRVRVLDNLAAPTHNGIVPVWLNKQAEFLKGDVRNKEDWEVALRDIDAVIHLAAYMDYHPDFSTYVRTNLESIALLFELILENKLPIKKIISASSQSVYGQGKYQCKNHGLVYPLSRSEEDLSKGRWELACADCGEFLIPLPEKEEDMLLPEIPYGISKAASEQLVMVLGRRYGIPGVVSRVSIALGPRQSFRHFYSGALRAFAVNVLSGEPIRMNEDGQQTRDFVHVKDVARAYLAVLENPAADFQIFNFGSGEATNVMDLAKMVAEEAGAPFNPSLAGRYRIGDARHSVMDVTKLKTLGWQPQHTLKDAVKEYLDWIRQFGNLKYCLDESYNKLKKDGTLHGY
jgi:dTDP-L-rhamnose 4-epimerase